MKRYLWWEEYDSRGRLVREHEADADVAGLRKLEASHASGYGISGYVRRGREKLPFTHETVPQVLAALREAG